MATLAQNNGAPQGHAQVVDLSSFFETLKPNQTLLWNELQAQEQLTNCARERFFSTLSPIQQTAWQMAIAKAQGQKAVPTILR